MLEPNATVSTLFLYNGMSEADGAAAELILAAHARPRPGDVRTNDEHMQAISPEHRDLRALSAG